MFINPQNPLTDGLLAHQKQLAADELTMLTNELSQSTASGQSSQGNMQFLNGMMELLSLFAMISEEEAQLAQNASGSGAPTSSINPIHLLAPLIHAAKLAGSGIPISPTILPLPVYGHTPHTYTLTTTETHSPTGSTKVTSFGMV